MVYHLVKKDLILVKNYWIILLIAAVGLPMFIYYKLYVGGEGLAFFLSTLFITYLLFNSISMSEYKFRGTAYLCVTPYTRSRLVIAKYVVILVTFVACYCLFTFTTFLGFLTMERLRLYDIGLILLVIQVIFGIIIPVQYRYGYERSKYIFFIVILLTPFGLPHVIKIIETNYSNIEITNVPANIQGAIFILLAIMITSISYIISNKIYSSKDL